LSENSINMGAAINLFNYEINEMILRLRGVMVNNNIGIARRRAQGKGELKWT